MGAAAGMIATRPGVLIKRSYTPERKKFIEYWKDENNRLKCRGENLVLAFTKEVQPKPDSSIYDFGAGTGRGGLALALMSGCKVTMVDIAPNCLDKEVSEACKNQGDRLSFLEHDMFNALPIRLKYGYAINFFNNVSDEDLQAVLKNTLNAVEKLYFTVPCTPERPFEWWVSLLNAYDIIVYLANEDDGEATFYTSSWMDAEELLKIGRINIENEELRNNIRTNIKRGFDQCKPYNRQEREVILLAGGASLADFEEEIKEKRAEGMALITTNGSYKWALDHGMTPSAQIIVDGREFNKKFLDPIIPECKYMLASQCHPSLFDDMPKDQTLIWHATIDNEMAEVLSENYENVWFQVLGGSTVILRGIILLRMLGYYKFHIYGFDSCLLNGKHHSYEQSENNEDQLASVSLGDQTFLCTTWMVCQAQEFITQVNFMGDEFYLAVYGNGLIANILSAAK